MSKRDVALAYQKLAKAEAAEKILAQAYVLAVDSGITREMGNLFVELVVKMGEHRSARQAAASDSLTEE